jgi:hypothetical protein
MFAMLKRRNNMSHKFKIDDKVRVINNPNEQYMSSQLERIGQVGTVLQDSVCPYVEFNNFDYYGDYKTAFFENKLELYVAEDETKHNFKVGDLVSFKYDNNGYVGQITSIANNNAGALFGLLSNNVIVRDFGFFTTYNNPFKVGQRVIFNNKIAIIKEFVGHVVKIVSGQHPNNAVEYVEFTSINAIEEPIVLNTNFQIGDKVQVNRKFYNNFNYEIEYEISDMYINEFNEVMCKLTHTAEELAEDLVLIDDIDIT